MIILSIYKLMFLLIGRLNADLCAIDRPNDIRKAIRSKELPLCSLRILMVWHKNPLRYSS